MREVVLLERVAFIWYGLLDEGFNMAVRVTLNVVAAPVELIEQTNLEGDWELDTSAPFK